MPMQFKSTDTTFWPYKFGSGADGAVALSSSTTWNAIRASCSGLSGSTSLSISAVSGTFTNGELVMIHQSRGTGAGNWELGKIVSGGGTSTLTLQHALSNTYTDSGASQAQVTKLYQYSSFVINSGVTLSSTTNDGNAGGIICFCVNETLTVAGTISASGKGYPGGVSPLGWGSNGYQGQGTSGAGTNTSTANGTGGGGGSSGVLGRYGTSGGGGGGHATSGTTGSYVTSSEWSYTGTGGVGGGTSGVAALTTMTFGGAGGSAGGLSASGDNDPGDGGAGGGIILLIAKNISISGSIVANGANGGVGLRPDNGGGGGGAGGSILIKSISATLGTNKLTVAAGAAGAAGGAGGANGGAGAVGRIHLDYLNSYSGSTSPTLDVSQDFSLRLGQSTGGVI